jgi:oligopeptide transport system ATP-binding protein
MEPSTTLQVENLTTVFDTPDGIVTAVDDVCFTLPQGKIVGLLGESGCGKTVTNLSIMRLLPENGRTARGRVQLFDENILEMTDERMRRVRGGRISMIFQEPAVSFNPYLRISTQMIEAIRNHQDMSVGEARQRSIELLDYVGIGDPKNRIEYYPHQLSGGMLQRVLIAMASGSNAEVILADEPTSSLDVTSQDRILELLKNRSRKNGTSILLVTHDLGVAAAMCDTICVMYAGRFVETAPVLKLYKNPQHPYTKALLKSIPVVSGQGNRGISVIQGRPPDLGCLPAGCAFHPRCPDAIDLCRESVPPLEAITEECFASCFRVEK